MVGRISIPKEVHVLILRNYKYTTSLGKKESKLQMEFSLLVSFLVIGRLVWII